jgi:hypothetical protein
VFVVMAVVMWAGIRGARTVVSEAGIVGVTRSKELRRIEAAIKHRNEPELKWALAECEIRKAFGGDSPRWLRLEKRIREVLAQIQRRG